MDKEKLRQYLQAIYPMPDKIALELSSDFEYFSFPKGKLLLEENKVNKQSYFLEVGYVRAFTFDVNGKELTTKLYAAKTFVNDFLAFFQQKPTRENFQCLTHCSGWTIDLDHVENYFRLYPEFREFGRLLVLHHYQLLDERMLEMIKDSAETRYRKLLTNIPRSFKMFH